MSIRNDKDKVCENCFLQYVTTKAVKRMEAYKSRVSAKQQPPQKLLVPISFGPSSTSLLSILDNHLQGQLDRMGRTTYSLFIVHVDLEAEVVHQSETSAHLEKLRSRFPNHTYLHTGITQALSLDIDWKSLGLNDPADETLPGSDVARLDYLLSLASSTTSKADIVSTLLIRLLVDVAKKNECESILFGDSTTRLAEKTLTETAKGRGFSLPWQVSDGVSPYGVKFLYPLRELLKKEILKFSSLTSPSLVDLIIYQASTTDVSASAKSTTIDDLMAQYFETVEEKFPAIVANVVRTSSFLLQKALMAYMAGVAIRAPLHNELKISIWVLQQSAMVALDLSTAKIQLLESFYTAPTSEDNITPNEAYHTAKVEILHHPTPLICQGLFTKWRDRCIGGEVEIPG